MEFKFEGYDELSKRLAAMAAHLKNPRATFDKAKIIMVGDIKKHFVDESGPNGKWPALKPATIKARSLNKKGTGNVKILWRSGRLINDINMTNTITTDKGVEVGTNVEYSPTHQLGDSKRNIPQRMFMWLSVSAQQRILTSFISDLKDVTK